MNIDIVVKFFVPKTLKQIIIIIIILIIIIMSM